MKNVNEYVKEIIETVKYFNWNLKQIWVENNCIYAERIRINGEVITEGLYAGSDFDPNDVYNVYSALKRTLDFNGMLVDNNIM